MFLGAGIFVYTFWGEPFNAVTLGNLAVVAFLSTSWNCYLEFRYPLHLPSFSVCMWLWECASDLLVLGSELCWASPVSAWVASPLIFPSLCFRVSSYICDLSVWVLWVGRKMRWNQGSLSSFCQYWAGDSLWSTSARLCTCMFISLTPFQCWHYIYESV